LAFAELCAAAAKLLPQRDLIHLELAWVFPHPTTGQAQYAAHRRNDLGKSHSPMPNKFLMSK